jgi:ribonuclease HII
MKKEYKYVVGVDEVGRGALVGPVVVAALALPRNLKFKIKNLKLPVRDSKKLSPKQREEWFSFVKRQKIPFATASVSPKIIDKINIANAANLAASRAVLKLLKSLTIVRDFSKRGVEIFLDGGLYLNSKFKSQNSKFQFKSQNFKNLKIKTIIKGDEKILAITLSSIVAKVTRDQTMARLHKKYPQYDFINNVGYGTKKHREAIKKYSPSPIHRKSFKIR